MESQKAKELLTFQQLIERLQVLPEGVVLQLDLVEEKTNGEEGS